MLPAAAGRRRGDEFGDAVVAGFAWGITLASSVVLVEAKPACGLDKESSLAVYGWMVAQCFQGRAKVLDRRTVHAQRVDRGAATGCLPDDLAQIITPAEVVRP